MKALRWRASQFEPRALSATATVEPFVETGFEAE
jgi:hypothetical protein